MEEAAEDAKTMSNPWTFLCPLECANLSMCCRKHWNNVAGYTPLNEWNEEYDNDVQAISADSEEDDLDVQGEEQDFSTEELGECYQLAMSTENPEQAFSEILENRRSKLRGQHGWLGGSQ